MAGFVGLNVGEYLARIGLAVGLGGLIGVQRGIDNHPAGFLSMHGKLKVTGLRTHILVSLGSCLFGIYSAYSWESFALAGIVVEPTRVSAQVVSGIGFIGGGVIVKQGLDIRGLTSKFIIFNLKTAASSIWSSAGIGLLSSVFQWIPALLGTAAIIVLFNSSYFLAYTRSFQTCRSCCLEKTKQYPHLQLTTPSTFYKSLRY
jgi:putative Mg2+ transporter-C (MgtC) family protein